MSGNVIDACGTILQTAGVGTKATDLFGVEMPDTPDACVAVVDVEGFGPHYTMGAAPTAVGRPRVLVLARALTYAAARTKIGACIAALGAIRAQTTGDVTFACILPDSDPFALRIDGDDRIIQACSFTCWTV